MTYTRMWDASTPLGSRDANEIDDALREKMLDVQERLITLMGASGNLSNDPCIPVGYDLTSLFNGVAGTGSAANIERSVAWFAGHLISSGGTIVKDQQFIEATAAAGAFSLFIPITIPVGATITSARARVYYNDAGHTITGIFKCTKDASDVYSVSLVAPVAGAAPQWIEATTPLHLIAADEQCGFSMVVTNNSVSTASPLRLYGVQVKYTHPGGVVR